MISTRSLLALAPGGLLTAASTDTLVIVAGAVLVALGIMACVLIIGPGVAPRLRWGRLKLDFERLRSRREPPPPDRSQEDSDAA